ncbi:hypothetical protein [Paenibacillus kandeliae]|uniref:hypothetical protein n=1 Tax=Paenibacillus kandeliae TaxID=3231269 RepID=UPI0034590F93
MPYTKAVITIEPYYERPKWMKHDLPWKPYMALTPQASEPEVEWFMRVLLGYHDIDMSQSAQTALKELSQQEGFIMPGGIAFFENEDRYILPSCCGGIEDINEFLVCLDKKISPWMGHDPDPTLTYDENHVYVWPDRLDRAHPENIPIVYTNHEWVLTTQQSVAALQGFLEGPLYNWLRSTSSDYADPIIRMLKEWLHTTK